MIGDTFSLHHRVHVHMEVKVPSLFPTLICCVYVYIYQLTAAVINLLSNLKQGGVNCVSLLLWAHQGCVPGISLPYREPNQI